jgi:hypothetical protein
MPKDRRGLVFESKGTNRHLFTTEPLNKALDRYREAVFNANKAAKQQLRQLAALLVDNHAIPLSAAARFNQALVGAEAHVEHCGVQKGWMVPTVGQPPVHKSGQLAGSSSSSSGKDESVKGQQGQGKVTSRATGSGDSSSSRAEGVIRRADGHGGVHINIKGMYPYWMDAKDEHTVRNDVDVSSMMLLTGPNMAGVKSRGRRG